MKKFILSLLSLLFLVAIGNAQISKGSIFIGGGVSVAHDKVKETDKKLSSISVSPAVGVAIRTNLVVGATILYSHGSDNTNAPAFTVKQNSYGGSVFLRKYVPLGKGFYIFGEADALFTGNNYKSVDLTQTGTQKGWTAAINLYPGLAYQISQKFHLEIGLPQIAGLAFSRTKYFTNQVLGRTDDDLNFQVSASNLTSVTIGFRVLLAK